MNKTTVQMNNMESVKIWLCERRHNCRWKCFALHHGGLSWGSPPNKTDEWRIYHDRECGGKLMIIEAIPEFFTDNNLP